MVRGLDIETFGQSYLTFWLAIAYFYFRFYTLSRNSIVSNVNLGDSARVARP